MRRRKSRSILTSITLILLTFTVLSFTSVRTYLRGLWKFILGPVARGIVILAAVGALPLCVLMWMATRTAKSAQVLVMTLGRILVAKGAIEGRWRSLRPNDFSSRAKAYLRSVAPSVMCKFAEDLNLFIWLLRHCVHATTTLVRAYASADASAHVIHCNDLNSLLAGVMLKAAHGCRLLYDAHELWPEAYAGAPFYQRVWFRYVERRLIPYADHVITVSPQIADVMEKWYNYRGIESVPNVEIWHDSKRILDTGLRALAGDRVIFLSQGSYFHSRGFEEMIREWESVDGTKALLVLRGPHHPFRPAFGH